MLTFAGFDFASVSVLVAAGLFRMTLSASMLDLRVEFPDSCFVSASVGTGFEQIWTKHLHLRFVGSSMCEPCLRGDPCQLVQAACSNGNSCIYTCTMGLQKGHLRQHTDFKYTPARARVTVFVQSYTV